MDINSLALLFAQPTIVPTTDFLVSAAGVVKAISATAIAASVAAGAINVIHRNVRKRLRGGGARDDGGPNSTLLRLAASPDESFYIQKLTQDETDTRLVTLSLPRPILIKVGGEFMVQVCYLQAITFDVESVTNHTITAFVQKDPTDPQTGAGDNTYTRNVLARVHQTVNATGWTYDAIHRVNVGRIVPFGSITIRSASSSGDTFVGNAIYDVVRISVFEFWNIIFTQYEIDVNAYFPLYTQLAQSTAWQIKIVQPS